MQFAFAALRNPTVRLRYLAALDVFAAYRLSELERERSPAFDAPLANRVNDLPPTSAAARRRDRLPAQLLSTA